MQLVEQHCIDRHDPRFAAIDPACFASKNLYNAALYILRQAFFNHRRVPGYAKLAHALKDTPDYRALPAKVAQWVVRQVCGDWDTFWLCRDKSETLGKEKSWKLVSIAQWVRGACGG